LRSGLRVQRPVFVEKLIGSFTELPFCQA